MKRRFEELARSPGSSLETIFRSAKAPALASIAGWEWRGFNTPPFTALLGIRKFIKGFFNGADGVEGYNIPARQNRFEHEWEHKPNPDAPKRFGFYLVYPVRSDAKDNYYPDALLLDYGASPRNFKLKPERVLRDYLVQPFADEPDVLLGKAYLALGPSRIPSNFFVLERLRQTSWKP